MQERGNDAADALPDVAVIAVLALRGRLRWPASGVSPIAIAMGDTPSVGPPSSRRPRGFQGRMETWASGAHQAREQPARAVDLSRLGGVGAAAPPRIRQPTSMRMGPGSSVRARTGPRTTRTFGGAVLGRDPPI